MNDRLERRYRRLLHAYPADYRAERGDELAGTYLDTVAPGRSRPGVRDVADVLAGSLRQRLRARGASGLPGGFSIAAVLALATGSMLATGWLLVIELAPRKINYFAGHPYGPFHTSAAFAWIAWLAAAVAFAVGSGRWYRWLIASALVATVLAKPVGVAVSHAVGAEPWHDSYVPSLVILVPQAALGVLALAAPSRPGRWVRSVPLLAALVWAVPVVRNQYSGYWDYAHLAPFMFVRLAAPTLLLATAIVVVALLVRRDRRALWVPLAVLPPLTLMSVDLTIYVEAVLAGHRPVGYLPTWAAPIWFERSVVSVVSTVVTVGVLWLAVALSGRRRPVTTTGERSRPDPSQSPVRRTATPPPDE